MTDNDMGAPTTESKPYLEVLERLLAIQGTDVRDALTQASNLLATVIPSDKVDVFVFDPSRESLVALGTSETPMGKRQHEIGMDVLPLANDGETVGAYETGISYITGNADKDPDVLIGISRGLGVRSILAVPLYVEHERRGVLSTVSAERERYTEGDLRFLGAIARWVGMTMHRAELAQSLAEEAIQGARRLAAEELLTVLAHDLRRPIGPIMNYYELIQRRARRENLPKYAEYAAQGLIAAQQLNAMVSDLLDVARLDQGLFAVMAQPVDLVTLVHEIAADMRTAETEIHVAAPEELVAHVDPARLRQALENLLANALRYSPPDAAVRITLTQERQENAEWAVMSVADRGPGIAPERIETLFERFEAGPGSTGLGLGLYLARGIAEAHGGTLAVASTPGGGATFTLALPLTPPA